jgi:hypothetical protein
MSRFRPSAPIRKYRAEGKAEIPLGFRPEKMAEKRRKNMDREILHRYAVIEDSIPKELRLKLLVQITSGLLASGDFTCEDDSAGEDYHFQLKIRCYELEPGKIEKDSTVVAVAERLLREIIESTYAEEIYDEQETSSNNASST